MYILFVSQAVCVLREPVEEGNEVCVIPYTEPTQSPVWY